MKCKLFLYLVLTTLALSSCKKDNLNSNTPQSNTVKLTIEGKDYVVAGPKGSFGNGETGILCGIPKSAEGSRFYLYITGSKIAFNIDLDAKSNSLTGLGTFNVQGCTGNYCLTDFVEGFPGGMAYVIKDGNVTITKNDGKSIEGTLSINVSNNGGIKTITGNLVINDPM